MQKSFIYLCCLFVVLLASQTVAQNSKKVKKQIETGYIPGADGSLTPDQSETIKLFDEQGNLVEEHNNRIYMNQSLLYLKKNFYTNKGMLDSSLIYNNDKFADRLIYAYDKKGKQSEIQEYGPDGKPSFKTKDHYDSLGNKNREELYTAQNELYNFKVYKYDKSHNLVDESGTEGGQPRYHWKYKYNKQNLLTERKDLSGEEVLLRVHYYQYGNDNRVFRENVKDDKGNLEKIIKYRYEFYGD